MHAHAACSALTSHNCIFIVIVPRSVAFETAIYLGSACIIHLLPVHAYAYAKHPVHLSLDAYHSTPLVSFLLGECWAAEIVAHTTQVRFVSYELCRWFVGGLGNGRI
jgi:hypothetical protein